MHTPTPGVPAAGTLSIAVTGSGGSGAVSIGLILLETASQMGLYGFMGRSAGPQIRGGESAALVRLGSAPVSCLDDRFDVLIGLDWLNVDRFVDEIPLDGDSLILADPEAGPVPAVLTERGARVLEAPFKALAKEVAGGRTNMVGLGVLAAVVGMPPDALLARIGAVFSRKGTDAVKAARACAEAGLAYRPQASLPVRLASVVEPGNLWNISGNEASGLGALRGGVRFVAAYPITPASEILEWLAPRLERVGGALLQAEDELASINMVIGASFGGVPSLTATSGPGLSLMSEGLGLAVASETPVVVVNVMRGGPSTGIPTKSEQGDLNMALYGLHGDAPHLVLAPLSIGDCIATTEWAVTLAERLQAPAIVLSDQSLGQSRAVVDPPLPAMSDGAGRRNCESVQGPYLRYQIDSDGVSGMALPGCPGAMYTADGLEHDERGTPSSRASDHRAQLEKRRHKLEDYAYGNGWADIEGAGDICLLTWGSVSGAAREAAGRLVAAGTPTRMVAVRLLAPLRRDLLMEALAGARRVVVVEQNHGAQFYHYLNAERVLPAHAQSYARPGPLPIRPAELVRLIKSGELGWTH